MGVTAPHDDRGGLTPGSFQALKAEFEALDVDLWSTSRDTSRGALRAAISER